MSKLLTGTVVSTKMNQTVVVSVVRTIQHPIYKKTVTRSKKYKAHVEGMKLKDGDMVEIQETRPMSKDKRFKVTKKQ
ncbi:MAG: 30S ribosomal protein S17 [Microgenomates group bacterium GW2011_GWC1_41_8]|uniref:Small ribosomal subunit protein uS17 n=2 Tax=Candidatus Roizmaniibacteriota TaxID=1752723 RepID=A0A0G0WBU4_9BACT|nr:MAG: 30S ribosomal protein S17 [Candidatus Roizmanbacteria bacterium GW2011_GWB1_40_7]KKR94562.1 MAG: 30S ribosomal protein S17 [Candidatus Roizmanbacteria bacterium GW2011_GWA1_41_13]KKS24250.1 MAG: 30S ribosomal protein S17 [Microgenomates group bacterium GW2011_GWC1_41_8]OGK48418.1 MAG: 30S ribosomal protein S17 [Candidatus Roizmanbacteria bacterium RIFCSPLOWO2_01_FULL_40_14]